MTTTSGARILVGTASWSDPEFVEHWYPKKMPAADRLAWYAWQFEMVEVNSTFYSIPDLRLAERWCASTPAGFTFNVKLHQLLSRHATPAKLLPPKLRRGAEIDARGRVKLTPALELAAVREFLRPVEVLHQAGKLGLLLLQLSPAFSPRRNRLAELNDLLDSLRPYRVAIEFRNRGWCEDEQRQELLEFMRVRAATLVAVDAPSADHLTIMPSGLDEITNPAAAYLRLHGRDAVAYTTGKTVAARFRYDYDDTEIGEVAARSRKLAGGAAEVHVVFNNNARDYAPHAAARMRAALGQKFFAPARTGELFS